MTTLTNDDLMMDFDGWWLMCDVMKGFAANRVCTPYAIRRGLWKYTFPMVLTNYRTTIIDNTNNTFQSNK